MRKLLLIFLFSVTAFAQTKIAPSQIQPGAPSTCLTTNIAGTSAVWSTCASGGTGYSTIQSAGSALFQRSVVNFFGALSCVDNPGFGRTDCTLTTPLGVSNGGTGLATLAVHQLYVGNGTSVPTAIATGTAGQVLLSGGPAADPSFLDPVVSQPTASLLNAQVQGPAATGTAKSGNPVQSGGVFNTTQPTVTNGQVVEQQSTARGAEIVATGVDAFNVNTTPPSNASTNVTQFGGTNISTGTGTGGAGIPRVTVSSDSTVTANAGTNLNTSALALDATLTGGTAKEITRGGAKGSTTAADMTSTASGANHQAADVAIYDASGNQLGLAASPVRIDPTGTTTQPVSGTITTTPPSNASTNVTQFGGTNVSTGTGTGGAGIPRVTVSSDSFPATQTVSGTVTTTPPANASTNVTQFGGTNVSTGTGTGGAGIPRVTVSSDSFPATQAISAASLPLPTGAATAANQTNGSEVVQVVQQPGQTPVPVAVSNLPQVQKVLSANTPLNPVPSTLVGNPPVSQGSPALQSAGWPTTMGLSALVQTKWDANTLSGATLVLPISGYATVELSINTGATTSGTVQFEVQDVTSNQWFIITGVVRANTLGQTAIGSTSTNASLGSFINQSYQFNVAGYSSFRARLSSVITGTGIATISGQASAASIGFAPETMASTGSTQTTMPAGMIMVGYKNQSSAPVPLSGDASGDINVNVAPGVSSQTINTANYTNFTSATAVNAVAQITGTTPNASGANSLSYSIAVPSNVTGGCIVFESSSGDGIWYPAVAVNYATGVQVGTLCFQPSTNTLVVVTNPGAFAQRLRLTQAVQGAGTVNASFSLMGLGAPGSTDNLYAVAGQAVAAVPTIIGNGLVVGGMGPDNLAHPIPVSNGAVIIQSAGLPLQPCNAVRITNCQHF